jgi:DNA repair photolyase
VENIILITIKMNIYEPQGRAREYSPLALNFKKGCSHNCKYCYVPTMFLRYNSSYKHNEVEARNDFSALEKSAKKLQGCGKQILLSFTGDPYCGFSPETTTKVLEILLKYDHKVAILTKGGTRSLRDLELFKKFGNKIKVGATLTFDNDKDSLEWESGAALPNDRIEALKILSGNGIKTWVSFEPVIVPEQSINLLLRVSPFVDSVKIGKLNNYKGIDKLVDWSDFIKKSVKICRENNLSFYIKNSLAPYSKDIVFAICERDQDYLNL